MNFVPLIRVRCFDYNCGKCNLREQCGLLIKMMNAISDITYPFYILQTHILSGNTGRVLPMVIFGILAIIAGLLSCLLPETSKRSLSENLEDLNQ